MPTEQSERIRAALLRAKATRQSSNAPTIESPEVPEFTSAVTETEFSEDSEPVETEIAPAEESLDETTHETESHTPALESIDDVEPLLPLLSASEKERAGLLHDEPPVPSRTAFKDEIPLPRARIESRVIEQPSRFPRIVLIIGGVIALAGLSIFLLRGRLWPDTKATGGAATFPLQMQVESQGNGIINIRWNPQSAAVTRAKEGRLVIAERDQQTRTIALNPEQLKIGHLFYQSPAERVEFRLEIVDSSGAVAKESVLALSSGASTAPAAGPPVTPTQNEPSTLRAKTEKATAPEQPLPEPSRSAKPAEIAKASAAQQAVRQPIRSFAPPPSQRKIEEPRAVLLDAPPVVPSGSVPLPTVSLPEAAVHIPAPQAKEPPATQTLKTGGNLQAPKLIKRVTPIYPGAAKAANVQGKVRFTATIAKDGTIHNLQAVSGPPVLVPAAAEAVKKWVYEPMSLNGEATEVITQIEVNFALHP